MIKQGQFITLEGGEGVGKSTNIRFIRELLEARGIKVVTTREPGGTILAEKIRQLLLEASEELVSETTELLLMFAARAQHIEHVIKPALAKGCWVLCDRFTDSTYAYQGGGRGMDTSIISWLEKNAQANISPTLTLLLDAPIVVGMDRASKRGELDRFEQEKQHFFEKVRESFLLRAEQNKKVISIINADQPLNIVQGQIASVIEAFILTVND